MLSSSTTDAAHCMIIFYPLLRLEIIFKHWEARNICCFVNQFVKENFQFQCHTNHDHKPDEDEIPLLEQKDKLGYGPETFVVTDEVRIY